MKLRIKGNTLRLRLSQTEVQTFAEKGKVTDLIRFGDLGGNLSYSLIQSNREKISCHFSGESLVIYIPKSLAGKWTESELVGMQENIPIGGGDQLEILVEKDFQCLHKRPNEDEKDNFPNPLASENLQ